MNWSDIATTVGKIAPMLGTLLGGPVGGAVGSMVSAALGVANTPDAVSQAIASDPSAAAKIIEIESGNKVKLQELVVAAEKNRLEAEGKISGDVNASIQAETKAEHWPSYSWRPAIGFAVAIDLTASVAICGCAYAGVMFFGIKPDVLTYLPAMLGAMAALVGVAMPILGIASWFRGKAQADPNNPAENKG